MPTRPTTPQSHGTAPDNTRLPEAHHPTAHPQTLYRLGHRLGPRPLLLHLMTALYASLSLPSVWPNLKSGSPSWKQDKNAATEPLQNLQRLLAENGNHPEFSAALSREGIRQVHDFISGVRHYQTSVIRRSLPDAPVIWQNGNTKLRDYAPHQAGGAPLLVVPSLINRYHILDLDEGQSFLRFLATRNLRPLLVDWDAPDETEQGFSLDAYMAHRLMPILAFIIRETGQTPHLMGYCMGGLLALALACLGRAAVRSLSLLATPWDFSESGMPDILQQEALLRVIREAGRMPVDMIQALFALQQPLQVFKKFRDFGRRVEEGAQDTLLRRFILVEDWLNDGVPLAAPVALACLREWYGRNATLQGLWKVGGQTIDPRRIALPASVIVPQQDRIVPPASSRPLASLLPDAVLLQPDTGHIGMMASQRAAEVMWQPYLNWIEALEAKPAA